MEVPPCLQGGKRRLLAFAAPSLSALPCLMDRPLPHSVALKFSARHSHPGLKDPPAGFLKTLQVMLVCGAWLFRTLFSHWVCLRAAASVVSDSLRSPGL